MASTLQFVGVYVIDFIAFALALQAEQRRSTAKVMVDSEFNYNYCVYDSNIATKLGIGASALFLVSQLLTLGANPFFCFKKHEKNQGCSICAYILSAICWATFFAAEAFLVVGSIKNAQRTKYRSIFGPDPLNCETLRKGVFEAAAAFIFITSLLSKMISVSYLNSEKGPNTDNNGSSELGTYTRLSSELGAYPRLS